MGPVSRGGGGAQGGSRGEGSAFRYSCKAVSKLLSLSLLFEAKALPEVSECVAEAMAEVLPRPCSHRQSPRLS